MKHRVEPGKADKEEDGAGRHRVVKDTAAGWRNPCSSGEGTSAADKVGANEADKRSVAQWRDADHMW